MIFDGLPGDSSDSTIFSVTSAGTGHGHLELHFPAGTFPPESIEGLLEKPSVDSRYDTSMTPAANGMIGEVVTDPATWEFLGTLGTALGTAATYDVLKLQVVQAFKRHQEQETPALPSDEELERLARFKVAARHSVSASDLKLVGLASNKDGTKTVVLSDEVWKYTLTFGGSRGGAQMVSDEKVLI